MDSKINVERILANFWTRRGKFQPIWFAENLLDKHYFKTTRDTKTIYVYNTETGIYEPIGETLIEQEMETLLGEELRARFYKDVEFKIRASTYFDRPKESNKKIVTNNGILNVETGRLSPFNPKEFITIHIPVIFKSSSTCLKIQKFIEEVVGEEQVPIIQEVIGYCLHQGYPFHKALVLVGGGANGKSTLINLIERLLGKENVSNTTLQNLCSNRFAPAQLYNKLANLCADLPDKSLGHTGMFKMLTGGDTIEGEQKFKDPFTFTNHAKLIFSTNKIPQTSDDTIAFFRRWIILPCRNHFPPSKANPQILKKICTPVEMSGLLNWALEGLKRLFKNGQFSHNQTFEELRTNYIRSSNSAKAFIEENLESTINHGDKLVDVDLYRTYISWCNQHELPTMRKAEFTKNMFQYIPKATRGQARIQDGSKKTVKRVWRHLTLALDSS